MSKVARDPERLWSENCEDVGYALGKNIIMYMLFEKEREKEIERVWKSRMEPFDDDEFKLKFIEDGDEYAFVIYRKHPGEESSIWLCRAGLEANGHYTNFKRSLQDELLFTYGLSRGERFRLSERYKIISDIQFIKRSEIDKSSNLWELLNREKEDK